MRFSPINLVTITFVIGSTAAIVACGGDDGSSGSSSGGTGAAGPQGAGGVPQGAGGVPQGAGGAPQGAGGVPQGAGGVPQGAGGAPQGGVGGGQGNSTAFRISELKLQTPRAYLDALGCQDITDMAPLGQDGVNALFARAVTTDDDMNGLLDASFLMFFDPLDQMATQGNGRFRQANCPNAGTCGPNPATQDYPYAVTTAQAGGTCLSPLASGTMSTPVAGPCFQSSPTNIVIDLDGIVVALDQAQVSATFQGNPATSLTGGLLIGFLSEANADMTALPMSVPIVGGQPLSKIMPGGKGSCQPATLEQGPTGPGWWFHMSFAAQPTNYQG